MLSFHHMSTGTHSLLSADKTGSILGYITFKDLVTVPHATPENPTLKGICRPIMFIPESMHVNAILRRMIREYQHIAIVQNSSGIRPGWLHLRM